MKKVVNVSVGGRSFSLDEDAYARLLTYFDHFKARLDRDTQSAKEEVMADLENRIAELFDQGTGGASYRVVNLALVTKVVEQLGMPDGSKEPKESESGTNAREQNQSAGKEDEYPRSGSGVDFTYNGAQGTSRRRLFRDLDNKTIGGSVRRTGSVSQCGPYDCQDRVPSDIVALGNRFPGLPCPVDSGSCRQDPGGQMYDAWP